jgi:hypothetical protein
MTNKLRALVTGAVFSLVVTTMATQASAFFLRVPQVPILGGSLQGYLNGQGESINVLTDQVDAQKWSPGASGNGLITIMIELGGNAPANGFGLYDANLAAPPLLQVFPGAASAGWFAVVSFQPGGLVVTLFDQNSIIQGQVFYAGALTNYGYYISGPGGTHYSEDSRNVGGAAQMVTFAGTGQNFGEWWICVEDTGVAAGGDQDFDDLIVISESVNPVKTEQVTLGRIKAMYRK